MEVLRKGSSLKVEHGVVPRPARRRRGAEHTDWHRLGRRRAASPRRGVTGRGSVLSAFPAARSLTRDIAASPAPGRPWKVSNSVRLKTRAHENMAQSRYQRQCK